MIDICCVGSGVKYRWLSYWSIVMTSQVEFSPVNFSQTGMKSPSNCITDQEKYKGLLESPRGLQGRVLKT